MSPPETVVRVLFVCTGNICRSPIAEGVFRTLIDAAGLSQRIEAASAGTSRWNVGQPPDLRAQQAALARGIDISHVRARQVIAGDFAQFNLIVGMDRSHRRKLLGLAPADSHAQVRLLLEFAPQAGTLDVPDPYFGLFGGFERVFDLIEAGAIGLVRQVQAGLS